MSDEDLGIGILPGRAQSKPRHMAWDVTVDRFTDAYLRENILPAMVMKDGTHPTVTELRRMCIDARGRGLEVFPPCENTDAKGRCKGHER